MDEGDYRGAIAPAQGSGAARAGELRGHLDLGICYAQKGFYAEAESAYGKRARAELGRRCSSTTTVAALYALWGKPAEALVGPAQGAGEGPAKVRGWLAADPMFDASRATPEFELLLSVQ